MEEVGYAHPPIQPIMDIEDTMAHYSQAYMALFPISGWSIQTE